MSMDCGGGQTGGAGTGAGVGGLGVGGVGGNTLMYSVVPLLFTWSEQSLFNQRSLWHL